MKSRLSGWKNRLFPEYGRVSYSQEGEDILLSRLLPSVERGFYVDVGAHHPKRFSNTYFFYRRGWSGINLDAMPGSMKPFEKVRPRDRNLELAIADVESEKTFYLFNDPALNTFDEALILSRISAGYQVVAEVKVRSKRLETVLEENLSTAKKIDFMSIDVEGYDLPVLRSNDWKKFRPSFVLAECIASNLSEIEKNEVYLFLKDQGYVFCAKTLNTFFFRDSMAARR